MEPVVSFELTFEGGDADRHLIDFYDVSQALIGFQRSLALTTHLVLNDEIITQAPALKGARIYAQPPEDGSWKFGAVVTVVAAGAYAVGTLPNNTVLGHLVFSLYDYVVSESLGVHVDYNKSLGQVYKEAQEKRLALPQIKQSQADSLIEKCSTAIREMHRPIYKNESAALAHIEGKLPRRRPQPLSTILDRETYDFISETREGTEPELIWGRVTSYNSNTYKGRIYVEGVNRPVAFELDMNARDRRQIRLITSSLSANALRSYEDGGAVVECVATRNTSRAGHLKSFTIKQVRKPSL